MRGSRLLIGLLVLATVLLDAVAFLVAQEKESSPYAAWVLFGSLALTQVSLLAIWAGLGSKRTPWRMLGMVMGVVAWSWAGASVVSTGYDDLESETITTVWSVSLLAIAVLVAAPLSIARAAGLSVTGPSDGSVSQGLETGLRSWQFTLGNLLGWTTAVAVLLSMLPCVFHHDRLGRLSWPANLTSAVGYAALALTGLWMVLGTRRIWLRILLLCSANGGLVAFILLYFDRIGTSAEKAFWLVLPNLLLLGSLGVFRVVGYRLRVCRGD
ncbi:MAG: hypothetical protein ACYSWU_07465 [Planctomycetota bacterium]|jgi:hypothetical protein